MSSGARGIGSPRDLKVRVRTVPRDRVPATPTKEDRVPATPTKEDRVPATPRRRTESQRPSDQVPATPTTPKLGFRVFHFPRVKSGHSTGALPSEIDRSESGIKQLMVAES